jgi:hypothetical protein
LIASTVLFVAGAFVFNDLARGPQYALRTGAPVSVMLAAVTSTTIWIIRHIVSKRGTVQLLAYGCWGLTISSVLLDQLAQWGWLWPGSPNYAPYIGIPVVILVFAMLWPQVWLASEEPPPATGIVCGAIGGALLGFLTTEADGVYLGLVMAAVVALSFGIPIGGAVGAILRWRWRVFKARRRQKEPPRETKHVRPHGMAHICNRCIETEVSAAAMLSGKPLEQAHKVWLELGHAKRFRYPVQRLCAVLGELTGQRWHIYRSVALRVALGRVQLPNYAFAAAVVVTWPESWSEGLEPGHWIVIQSGWVHDPHNNAAVSFRDYVRRGWSAGMVLVPERPEKMPVASLLPTPSDRAPAQAQPEPSDTA